jgi:hypothetical protein
MANYDSGATYDEVATYDSTDDIPVVSVITLGWQFIPEYEEHIMADSLNYTLNIQRVDTNNAIRNQADTSVSISLPDNFIGDETRALSNGQLDQPVTFLNSVMDIIYIQTDMEITVKFNAISGTPFLLRAGGSMLVDGKNLTALYLSNTSGSTAVVRVIQALRQDI